MNQDMSIYDPMVRDAYNATEAILSYCCYELVEYIMKELGLYEV